MLISVDGPVAPLQQLAGQHCGARCLDVFAAGKLDQQVALESQVRLAATFPAA
jgi:hypothetical protein